MINNPTDADGVKCYSLGEVMDHVADPTTEHPTKWALWADFLKLREELEATKKLANIYRGAVTEYGQCDKHINVIAPCCPICLMEERDQAHDAAVEGCAKVCDRESHTDLSGNSSWLARQIRKLKRGGNG